MDLVIPDSLMIDEHFFQVYFQFLQEREEEDIESDTQYYESIVMALRYRESDNDQVNASNVFFESLCDTIDLRTVDSGNFNALVFSSEACEVGYLVDWEQSTITRALGASILSLVFSRKLE